MKPRIVCAANECISTKELILGVRHYDQFMHGAINSAKIIQQETNHYGNEPFLDSTQGFVDQFGKSYTREEAWIMAEANGQIIRRVGGDTANGGTLYSENLY